MSRTQSETTQVDHRDTLFAADDPIELFCGWLDEARRSETINPEAMSLATVDEFGLPNVRMVLLKKVDHEGFVFYTNTESQKADELRSCPQAALCFYWKSLRRQVRLQGPVSPVSDEEADEYFATRSKDAQIGAWASKQSRPLKGRFELEAQVAKYATKYALKSVERPPFWSGYCVRPKTIEFWRERAYRLHDRRLFVQSEDSPSHWTVERLYP